MPYGQRCARPTQVMWLSGGAQPVVVGGRLPAEVAWLPPEDTLEVIDGETYITLKKKTNGLGMLFPRAAFSGSCVLARLQKMRSQACEEWVNAKLGAGTSAPSMLRLVRQRWVREHEAELPIVVPVHLDEKHGVVKMRFELDKRKSVTAKLDCIILDYLLEQVATLEPQGTPRKSKRRTGHFSLYPEVRMNKGVPFIEYVNEDGKTIYHQENPRVKDGCDSYEDALQDAARQLHEFYLVHNRRWDADSDDHGDSTAGGESDEAGANQA